MHSHDLGPARNFVPQVAAVFCGRRTQRLDAQLDAAYRYIEPHFGGQNHYVSAVEQNIQYARKLAGTPDKPRRLRRRPPNVVAAVQGQLQFN